MVQQYGTQALAIMPTLASAEVEEFLPIV